MDCRSKMKCQVNGCGWKHHTMLHVKKKSNKATVIAPLLTILQSPRMRLERVPSVEPERLERVPSAGPAMLVGAVLQTLARRKFV